MEKLEDYRSYQLNYSESKLWNKISSVAHKAGAKVVYAVLLLYYVATGKDVSWADKAKIYGVLGYFILPLDVVPDLAPLVGYTDDLTALLWVLHTVWSNVTPEVKSKARARLSKWFGELSEEELKLF